jgi:biotin operon repressor
MKVTNSQLFEAAERSHSPPQKSPVAPLKPTVHQPWNSPAVPARSFQSWWIHLWSGLARDSTAKHQKAMGNAIWLYLYLLVSANRSDGIVLRRLETIAEQTGYNERTVARWMQDLREKGYITSTTNGRSLRIQITKWRPSSSTRLTPKSN